MATQTPIAKQTVPLHDERIGWTVPNTVAQLQAELSQYGRPDRRRPLGHITPDEEAVRLVPHRLMLERPHKVFAFVRADALRSAWVFPTYIWSSAAEALPTSERTTVDEFITWLDSEDFGDDPTRIRREAWGERE